MWIWQHKNWHNFTWDRTIIDPLLRDVRLNQGMLIGKLVSHLSDTQKMTLDTLLANILHSSAIENERLNTSSVRSSLAKRLGLNETHPYPTTKKTDGLAEIMLDAIENYDEKLTLERLLHWHECLFPKGQTNLYNIIGGQLRDESPMQVVSGAIGREKVHFEAPGREVIEAELDIFIRWFNGSKFDPDLDPLVRAAIVHLWFVTLHPFEDGNGRITRFLTDLALAQAEKQSIRSYAMSVTLMDRRNQYYEALERSQKGDSDITSWLSWFLDTLNSTFLGVMQQIDSLIFKTQFWQKVDQTKLSSEQVKVLNRMLDGDFEIGINTTQYARVAKVSKPTATRHLASLVELGCLVKSPSGGRSTRYLLPESKKINAPNEC